MYARKRSRRQTWVWWLKSKKWVRSVKSVLCIDFDYTSVTDLRRVAVTILTFKKTHWPCQREVDCTLVLTQNVTMDHFFARSPLSLLLLKCEKDLHQNLDGNSKFLHKQMAHWFRYRDFVGGLIVALNVAGNFSCKQRLLIVSPPFQAWDGLGTESWCRACTSKPRYFAVNGIKLHAWLFMWWYRCWSWYCPSCVESSWCMLVCVMVQMLILVFSFVCSVDACLFMWWYRCSSWYCPSCVLCYY